MKKKRRSAPLPGHLILDAVAPLVAPHLEGTMTLKTWRLHNASAAHAMADAGVTPDVAAQAWQDAYERTDRPPIVLRFLHDRIATSTPSKPQEPELPRYEDLVAAGTLVEPRPAGDADR